jgi:hypothetical protein
MADWASGDSCDGLDTLLDSSVAPVARMAAFGPLLPSAASAGRGSYVGISCRRRERRAMAEDDPKPPPVDPASTFWHFSPRLG